jgi:hypothetical protein
VSVEVNPALRDTPNPGSDEAVASGCTCPVLDNGRGLGYLGVKGLFVYSGACPMHRKSDEVRP